MKSRLVDAATVWWREMGTVVECVLSTFTFFYKSHSVKFEPTRVVSVELFVLSNTPIGKWEHMVDDTSCVFISS